MQSSYYDVEKFKQGYNMLRRLEQEELGDVRDRSLLELQCHIGVNSLSLARMGARVTGTDISDEAIDIARELAGELDLDASFVQANLYDLPKVLDGEFDMVFTGYGTLSFLPDITGWAKVAARYVKPGGTLTVVEIHPMLTLFSDVGGELRVARSCSSPGRCTTRCPGPTPTGSTTRWRWRSTACTAGGGAWRRC
ncbi:class I SAM-dependent methyltransferase [Streptomyces nogalater]